ncbi:MAG: D-tyrosyl-tRNA(Tyr) deacylase [Phycisphaeraceae bacterium]|nr:D-tyrosyl-tRNA(Tyr) deacylase [Phycisphaeraceae bacterium]
MVALVQRCLHAWVQVEKTVIGQIGPGIAVFVGLESDDDPALDAKLAAKLLSLRVFADTAGKMNRNVVEAGGNILLIPNFTLAADTSGGNRPSFIGALAPDLARPRFESLPTLFRPTLDNVQSGRFGADMQVEVLNDGPVSLILRLK